MAKKKSRGRRNGSLTLPLAVIAGIAVPVASSISKLPEGGPKLAAQEFTRTMTGYDFVEGKFNIGYLKYGLLPVALGAVVHKFVGGRLGINRALAGAGIPLLRL